MTDRKYTPEQVEAIIRALRPGDTITAHRRGHPEESESTLTCWKDKHGDLNAGVSTFVRYSDGTGNDFWLGDNPLYVLSDTSHDPFKVSAANLPIGSVVGVRNEGGSLVDANVKIYEHNWRDTGGNGYHDRDVQSMLDVHGYTVIARPDMAVQEVDDE